jgi:RNA polymerase sigma-B factor
VAAGRSETDSGGPGDERRAGGERWAYDDLATGLRTYRESGDRELRDRLVEAHIGLVHQLARRFANRGEALDDLVQAGSIGLVKAVERFDPDHGAEFAAYASATIVGELKRHFRDKGWAVRAPRRVQELFLGLGDATSRLAQELGRSPTVGELARELGASEDEVLEAMEAGYALHATSLDTSPVTGSGTIGERIGSEDAELSVADTRVLLDDHLSRLDQREQTVIKLRFYDDLTQSEIAERIGVSQMHVSRLLARSLRRLQQLYEDEATVGVD